LCRAGIIASQRFIVVSDNQQEKEPPEIKELAVHRTEGVKLRNLGERLTDSNSLPEWINDYIEWDRKVLNTLGKLSKAKSEWLRTLDRMPIQPVRWSRFFDKKRARFKVDSSSLNSLTFGMLHRTLKNCIICLFAG
jgi:hypothetical protein